MTLQYIKISSSANEPTRATEHSYGLDIRAAYAVVIPPHTRELIVTQLQIQVPFGCYERIAPRSGLAWKHEIDVCAGVIDADYRGEIMILLHNHGLKSFTIRPGDKIDQLICEKCFMPVVQEVESVEVTSRSHHGFGSTGVN